MHYPEGSLIVRPYHANRAALSFIHKAQAI